VPANATAENMARKAAESGLSWSRRDRAPKTACATAESVTGDAEAATRGDYHRLRLRNGVYVRSVEMPSGAKETA